MAGKGFTPQWRRSEHERFARAVEGGPHDQEMADELAIVELLRNAGGGPDQATRDRMKQRVLTAPAPTGPPSRRSGARVRLAVAAAAALCLVLSLTGMSVLLSRDALPGDTLYGIKRTAESASLGLTFDEESRGLKHLEFAAARISEMESLAERDGTIGNHLTALADFDTDAAAGTRLLTELGANSDGRVLSTLGDWAQTQASRLSVIKLPEQVSARATGSIELLDRIYRRAGDLGKRINCSPITTGQFDELGPLPVLDTCINQAPVNPNASSSRLPASQPTEAGSASAGQPSSPPLASAPPSSTPGLLPLPPIASKPPIQLPSNQPGITIPLPLPLPSISIPGLPGIGFGS